MLPSWIKSKSERLCDRPTYFLAILTTSLKLASVKFCLAVWSPFSIFLASLTSSSALSKGTLPISLRYICTKSETFPLISSLTIFSSAFFRIRFSFFSLRVFSFSFSCSLANLSVSIFIISLELIILIPNLSNFS